MKAKFIFIFLVILIGCGDEPSFEKYLAQFPSVPADTFTILPYNYDCSQQKKQFPGFAQNNNHWLSHFSNVFNDSEFVAWPAGKVKLPGDRNALVLGICDTRYDEGPPEFWLDIFNSHGDSIQCLRLNPFLFEEAHQLAILCREEKFITLYQNVAGKRFLRMTWQLSGSDNLYHSVTDTLDPDQFSSLYPAIKYKEWLVDEVKSNNISMDTLYVANCDLDMDGNDERVLLIQSTPQNEAYSLNYFLTVKAEQYDKTQGKWSTWIETNKLLPVSDGQHTSSEITKCGNGNIEMLFQEDKNYILNFNYSAAQKQLILKQVVIKSADGTSETELEAAGTSINQFDFKKFYLGR